MTHPNTASGDAQLSSTIHRGNPSQSEQDQQRLQRKWKRASKFSELEKSAFEVDSKEAFENYWRNAIGAQRGYTVRHDHRKVARNGTYLAKSASKLWENAEPFLNILKDAGPPFTGAAFGTIAFVFMVAQNREKMENQIDATIKSINDRLPGLEIYQRIYQNNGETDERLQAKFDEVYSAFMDFCETAVEFYTKNGFHRWLKALGNSHSIEEKASVVEEAIVKVRLVCEELLNKNVADVKSLNEAQAKQIEGLIRQVEELRHERDGQKLETMSGLLQVDHYSTETEPAYLQRHRGNILAEHKQWYSCQETPNPLAFVMSDPKFQSWHKSVGSGILLIVGRNMITQARHCWLSPVALDFISKCNESSPQSHCVFYLLGNRTADDTFDHVASSLIYRLLNMNQDVLRDEKQYTELQAETRKYENATRTRSALHIRQELLGRIALRAFNMLNMSTTVWIILDRLDQCQGGGSRNLHRKTLLRFLVKLVENENLRVRVRVLAIVNGVDWRPEEQSDEIGQTKKESVEFWTLEQTQFVGGRMGVYNIGTV
ncbi:hypothetical protein GGS21DRAFT_487150 [Xylaria nigripes]|nr:hypothetical protein GGS21DRAFT_487150 [Xylaria nigripes]